MSDRPTVNDGPGPNPWPWLDAAVSTPLLPEPVRRLAAWCAVFLLVTGVVGVAVWLCVTFRTAVTPALLALLGTALLGPMHRRLVRMKVNRSLAAALTCLAVVAFVGGVSYARGTTFIALIDAVCTRPAC